MGLNLNEWRCDEKAKTLSYFSIKNGVEIHRSIIDELKRLSKKSGKVNARLCLHNDPNETLHDMIILAYGNKTCRKPHKNLDIDNTVQIIEGKLVALIFDDEGNLVNKAYLEPNNKFIYRTPRNQFHLYLPATEFIIYRETKQGPFSQNSNIFPKWDYIKILKDYVDFMDLKCDNESCKRPCSLSRLEGKIDQ